MLPSIVHSSGQRTLPQLFLQVRFGQEHKPASAIFSHQGRAGLWANAAQMRSDHQEYLKGPTFRGPMYVLAVPEITVEPSDGASRIASADSRHGTMNAIYAMSSPGEIVAARRRSQHPRPGLVNYQRSSSPRAFPSTAGARLTMGDLIGWYCHHDIKSVARMSG